MGINVKWNRDYNTHIAGYDILRSSTGRNGTYGTTVASGIAKEVVSHFDADGVVTDWYRIVSKYANDDDTWNTDSATSQYFTSSPVPQESLRIHDAIVPAGGSTIASVGCYKPNNLFNILIDGVDTGTTCTTNSMGYWSGTIQIPAGILPGNHTIAVADDTTTLSESIMVSNRIASLISILEDDVLMEFQSIKVHHEGVIESNIGNSIYKFAFGNWNLSTAPEFLVGDGMVYTQDAYIDFISGTVGLTNIETGNDVFGTYAFKFFTQNDLYQYMAQSCNELNLIKPFTQFTLESMPSEWDALIMHGSYKWALRRILQSLIFRDIRLATIGDGAVGIIQSLLNDATTNWTNIRKDAKRRGMVQPGVVVSGRYRMPIRVTSMNWGQFAGVVT